MAKSEYRKIILKETCARLKIREFEQRGIIFWIVLGLIVYYCLSLLTGVDLWIEIAISFIPIMAKLILSFLHDYFFIIPEEQYQVQKKIIRELENSFISPSIDFFVLPLGKAMKNDGYRYASIIVKNYENNRIEEFWGTITSLEVLSGNCEWIENEFANPDSRKLIINDDKERDSIDHDGGTARFDVVRGNGETPLEVLNYGLPHKISLGERHKIKITFEGIYNGNPIKPIKREYDLNCSYKDDERKTGIFIVGFNNYD